MKTSMPMNINEPHKRPIPQDYSPLRRKMHTIIFEADTFGGKLFDVLLLIFILLSVLVVMLESIPAYGERYRELFYLIEWFFTILFTIEYLARIYCSYNRWGYIRSFFGIIDLLAILPTYLSIFLGTGQQLTVVRILRLMRIFRIFKLVHFIHDAQYILSALIHSRRKITVFLLFVLLMTTIFGSMMYIIEGPVNEKFDSIPRSIYWAIVTLTTVGYGDISPITPLGQFISAVIMILGYSVIALPTGIVSSEIIRRRKSPQQITTQVCPFCSREGHDSDAVYCKYCGNPLHI